MPSAPYSSKDLQEAANPSVSAKHTPGPWRVGMPRTKVEVGGVEREIGVDFLTNEGQRTIMAPDPDMGFTRVALVDCKTPFKRGTGHESKCDVREANAAFIVQACNSHEELVEALRECKRYFANRPGNHEVQLNEICWSALQKAGVR